MRLFRYLLSALLVITFTACEPEEAPKRSYPELTTLDNTMWYSYDQKSNIYYDIYYDGDAKGRMLGYDTSERVNEIVNRSFTYTYTRATEDLDAIVDVFFEDGQRYGGILIPKGNLQINNQDVYWIQLYELTADGEDIAYDDNGKYKSTILMWME